MNKTFQISKNVFKKILGQTSFEAIFDLVIIQRIPLLIKTRNEDLISIVVDQLFPHSIIAHGHPHSDANPWRTTCSFQLSGERYFFVGIISVQGSKYVIQRPFELYMLQRRSMYRLPIPTSIKAFAELKAGKTIHRFLLRDLSAGGCLVAHNNSKLALGLGEDLETTLLLPDRDPIVVPGQVRHIRRRKDPQAPFLAGIQFIQIPEKQQNKLAAIVMELYREHFARWKSK